MEAWVALFGMLFESYENNTHREARIQNWISDLPGHHREMRERERRGRRLNKMISKANFFALERA